MVMGTLGKYNRSVSIIGVGCTPFMYTVDNPETNGLTEGEMFGYAALKAMEDAGVNPQDVDFYFHGEASPLNGSNYLTPNGQVANWFGMKGKGSIHHSEACCTGYLAIEHAVNAVAAGKYNCVRTGAVEFGDSTPSPADNVESPKHPYKRDKTVSYTHLMDMQVFRNFSRLSGLCQVFPQCGHEIRIFCLVREVKLHKPGMDQEPYLRIFLFIQLQDVYKRQAGNRPQERKQLSWAPVRPD